VKITEARERGTDELRNMEKDLTRELWQARLDNHTNQLDDTAKIRRLRRSIAQIKTVLTERELTATEQE
jgi:large subunit ribosomal protein L29